MQKRLKKLTRFCRLGRDKSSPAQRLLCKFCIPWSPCCVHHARRGFPCFLTKEASQRRRNDINKMCVLEGGGNWGKIVPKCCFSWKFRDDTIQKKIGNLIVGHFLLSSGLLGPDWGFVFVLKFVRSRFWGEISSTVLSQLKVLFTMTINGREWPFIAVIGR